MKRVGIKDILSVIVALLLIGGVIAAIGSITGNTKESVSGFAFSIGGLDDAGEYVERKNAIYTKDLIGCVGLEVTPDFESAVKYRVFYYDENETFISATDLIDEAHVNKLAQPKYCRIMIVPESGEEINFWEFWKIYDFADDISIKVDKEQIEPKDYFDGYDGKSVKISGKDIASVVIEGYHLDPLTDRNNILSSVTVTYYDASGNVIGEIQAEDRYDSDMTVELPEGGSIEIWYSTEACEAYGAISIEVYEYR